MFLPSALAAAMFDISFATTTGVVLADMLSIEPAMRRPRAAACAAAMVVALSLQVGLAVAGITGSWEIATLRSESVDVIAGTHAGRMAACSLGCAILALLCSTLLRAAAIRNRWVLGVLALLAAARAATGHAAVEGAFSLAEVVQFVHLESIAIWSGAVIASGVFVLPQLLRAGKIEPIAWFAARLSRIATIALLLVVGSGMYNSYRGMGASLTPLAHTQWGVLLSVKLLLVFAAVSLGAYSRRIVRARSGLSRTSAARLVRAVRWESLVMLLILTISAFLANSAPPAS